MVFFGYYLVERGLVTSDHVLEALDRQHTDRVPIGQLAQRTGTLTKEQVYEVLNHQDDEVKQGQPKKPFGQVAREMGLLKKRDIVMLLGEQSFRRKPLGEILVEMGAITEDRMESELQFFMSSLGDI